MINNNDKRLIIEKTFNYEKINCNLHAIVGWGDTGTGGPGGGYFGRF